ncbi:MAG: peptidoglycan-binding domain-containing protein [Rudaea sp.]
MSSQENFGSGASSAEAHNAQTVRDVQQALKQKGFDVGAIDGQIGPETQNALRDFQQSQGLPQSGNLDPRTLSALGVSAQGPSISAQGQSSQASATQASMSSGPSASSASRDANAKMQENRNRMQDGGTTNGTETTPASPK